VIWHCYVQTVTLARSETSPITLAALKALSAD